MQKRASNTRQILEANKHLVLSRSRSHQQALAVTLASLQSDTGIAAFASHLQAVHARQRLVDHHRSSARKAVNRHVSSDRQIARCRLLDVLQSVVRQRAQPFDALQQVDHIVFVRTLLVKVKR